MNLPSCRYACGNGPSSPSAPAIPSGVGFSEKFIEYGNSSENSGLFVGKSPWPQVGYRIYFDWSALSALIVVGTGQNPAWQGCSVLGKLAPRPPPAWPSEILGSADMRIFLPTPFLPTPIFPDKLPCPAPSVQTELGDSRQRDRRQRCVARENNGRGPEIPTENPTNHGHRIHSEAPPCPAVVSPGSLPANSASNFGHRWLATCRPWTRPASLSVRIW